MEGIDDGFFVVMRGIIVFFNNTFARMHGCAPEETIGRHYLELAAPESREEVQAAYIASMRNGSSPARLEYLRLHQDGCRMPTEIMAKNSPYGGEVATIGICRDISQRVELE